MAQKWGCVVMRELSSEAEAIAHNLNRVFIKLRQWDAESLNSTMLRVLADRSSVEFDRVKAQST
jgi:hypothetical protein